MQMTIEATEEIFEIFKEYEQVGIITLMMKLEN
jgi:hypothetical protein